ncbi:hypothetical protein F2P56_011366 [Juglans regia]|uniref:Zinc knuckle CX2CX4HX4C domain-containing protein n=2 Tax=Juglans regia TaxID=51240 RepID=A0A833XSP3_JUGRE|nr:uncharacterized protein LOC108997801 [Juglans regia]KAF5470878.1 hypothetical protein F2P56_011366 [Juglans regia]
MEDIEVRWKQLRLLEEEEVVLEIPFGEKEDVKKKGDLSLIGKVCSDRSVGKDIISNAMAKIWRISKRAIFQEVDKNVFVLTFATHADKQRILDGRPWLFDNVLFPLRPYDGLLLPGQIKFESEIFWVQLHDLPLGLMTRECGERIGGSVGKVIAVDVADDGIGWGRFLRVKIEISLYKPVARGRFINHKGDKLWISFQYEKLPKICFRCGCIAHIQTGCSMDATGRQDSYISDVMQFGAWLRVDGGLRRRVSPLSSDTSFVGKEGESHKKDAAREGSVGSSEHGGQRKEMEVV